MSVIQQLAEPLVYGLAFAITLVSGGLLYRQRLSAYQVVRSAVLGIYALITLLMLVDMYRVTLGTLSVIPAYSAVSIALGLLQGLLLLVAAQGIYFGPATTRRNFLRELAKRRGHLALFVVFVCLIAIVELFPVAFQPPSSGLVTDIAGNHVPAMKVASNLIVLVLGALVFFLVYPTSLLILSATKIDDRRLRRSVVNMGLGWAAVSGLFVLAEVAKWTVAFDFTGLMYVADAAVFFMVIRDFRKSASLAGFVAPKKPAPERESEKAEAELSSLAESVVGRKLLYEVDPEVPYEKTLRGILEELAWAGHAVFVFTPRSGPLHDALSGGTSLKFFLTTSGVSYMKVSEDTSEVLVPQGDTAIFLDVADKTLNSRKGGIVFVFDNVSELLLLIGLERTYKFLKKFLELLHEQRSTAFFLFIRKAHESREVNLLRGIFPSNFVEDPQGARLVK